MPSYFLLKTPQSEINHFTNTDIITWQAHAEVDVGNVAGNASAFTQLQAAASVDYSHALLLNLT